MERSLRVVTSTLCRRCVEQRIHNPTSVCSIMMLDDTWYIPGTRIIFQARDTGWCGMMGLREVLKYNW